MHIKIWGVRWLVPLAAVMIMVASCESTPEDVSATSSEGDISVVTASDETFGSSDSDVLETEPINVVSQQDTIEEGDDPSAPIPGTQEDLVQNVGDRVFFDTDSAVLTPDGRRTLERQAEWLRLFPELNVTIEGHCDERGTREYNLALGERRATAVRDYLITFGVEASRMRTTSYGKERPYQLGHNKDAWDANRRSVTVVN